jgi:hypothetical protein
VVVTRRRGGRGARRGAEGGEGGVEVAVEVDAEVDEVRAAGGVEVRPRRAAAAVVVQAIDVVGLQASRRRATVVAVVAPAAGAVERPLELRLVLLGASSIRQLFSLGGILRSGAGRGQQQRAPNFSSGLAAARA